jgi:crotonobetainyl-CoA:carnitine CoA-transferase CaiB-like acyl-CoA transferase
MSDNLFPFMYWAMGNGLAAGEWPKPGGELVTGGSPRYQIYRTEDDRFLAAAPLEDRFWGVFCDAIGLPPALCDDKIDPRATKDAVAALVRALPAEEWRRRFSGKDACCAIAATLDEAMGDPHFSARGLFAWKVAGEGGSIAAVPVPVAPEFRAPPGAATSPALGEANALLGEGKI